MFQKNTKFLRSLSNISESHEPSSMISYNHAEPNLRINPHTTPDNILKWEKLVKFVVLSTNIVFLISGLLALGISIWALIDGSTMDRFLGTWVSTMYTTLAYILCACGVPAIAVALLGCCGVIKEIKCLLGLYILILCLIFFTIMVGGILSFIMRKHVRSAIEGEMRSSMKVYYHDLRVRLAWDVLQKVLRCCGVYSFAEWRSYVPASCCVDGNKTNEVACVMNRLYFQTGCLKGTEHYLKSNASVLGCACIVTGIIVVVAIISSCALYHIFKMKQKCNKKRKVVRFQEPQK